MDLLDYRTLRSGGLYRVRRSFTDNNSRLHRVGEEWTYLGYREDGSTVVFLVRGSSGEQRAVPLLAEASNGAVGARDLSRMLGARFEIPEWLVGHFASSGGFNYHRNTMVIVVNP